MSGAYVVAMYTINFVHAAYVPNNSNLRAHQPNHLLLITRSQANLLHQAPTAP